MTIICSREKKLSDNGAGNQRLTTTEARKTDLGQKMKHLFEPISLPTSLPDKKGRTFC